MSNSSQNPTLNPSKDPLGRAYQGPPCGSNDDCGKGEGCGHPGDDHLPKICCPHGTYKKVPLVGPSYCRTLPRGYFCANGKGCENGTCGHPEGSASTQTICCYSGKVNKGLRDYCGAQAPGVPCHKDHDCATNNCVQGKCSATKKLTFGAKLEQVILYGLIALIGVIIFIIILRFA